jgi:crotonobetainyl-CoA:carnitine CoA-transferase CaiB-like acyl-CoA transferase
MTALKGCRVLDLGIITAGAATSAILADLGAEVLKIESPSYNDPFRRWTGETLPGEHVDLPPFFRMTNRGKFNVGIDLKKAEGRAIFLKLVEQSDIVVENFSRGVLGRLGLDFATLRSVNPKIILASISSQGDDGPDANFISFGSTLEAMAGLAAVTGYADGPPVVSGIELNYPDQVVAIFAAAMAVTAWHATKAGKAEGVQLDLSQRELTSFLCGEQFIAPETAKREGNSQGSGLQDCFRSRDGEWVAVTIAEDQLAGLGLAPEIQAAAAAAWFAALGADAIIARLTAAGAAAARVLDGNGVLAERGKGWSAALAEGRDGETVKGGVFAEAGQSFDPGIPASLLGTHTRAVLSRLLGYDDAAIDRLIAAGAIAENEQTLPETALAS